MVVRRRKKVTKYRGHITHGGGHRKKRRGAGSRGGRGRAGSGKRSGHKKNILTPIGKKGFTSLKKVARVHQHPAAVINVGDLTFDRLQSWLHQGKISKEDDTYVVNLQRLGYQKLLGAGDIIIRVKVIVSMWSAQAAEKIKAAGGNVISTAVAEA
jgi:large subunit ribosomal protein L15